MTDLESYNLHSHLREISDAEVEAFGLFYGNEEISENLLEG